MVVAPFNLLSIVALARMSLLGICAVFGTGLAFGQSSAVSDYAARCAAPGVVLCKGLDSEADVQAGIGTAGDDSRQGFVDAAQSASGAGSLKFTLRAGNSTKNIGGSWTTDLGRSFRSGDTLYVQYRWRASPEYFSNNEKYWKSSVKQLNIHGPSSTCQGAEFTTVLYNKYVSMYTNCGDGWNTDVGTNALLDRCSGDCLLQQGASTIASPSGSGYNCHYWDQTAGDGKGSGCYMPTANKWITHYEVIKLGDWGGSNTVIDAFVAQDGGAYKQWQRVSGVRFNNNRDSYVSKFRLETYMTEIAGAAPTPAYVWYDEVIVSTQAIAAPGGAISLSPNPPTNVSAR